MKKLISMMLILVLCLALTSFASAEGAQLGVSSPEGKPGDTVNVNITLSGNPGIASLKLSVAYDADSFELVSAADGGTLPGFTAGQLTKNPYTLMWSNSSSTSGNGTLATLSFRIKEGSSAGSKAISVSAVECYNQGFDDVSVAGASGSVTVNVSCDHALTHHPATEANCGTGANGNTEYWECSKCGKYFSDGAATNEITDKNSVVIAPAHSLTHVAAKDAGCTEDGNKEYWECGKCHKLFSDAAGTTETNAAAVKVSAQGHSLQKIDGKAATCTETGVEDYWKCTRCNKLFSDAQGKNEITAPVTIPVDANAHNLEKVNGTPATCTEAGVQDYWKCTRCNKLFSDAQGKNEITAPVTIPAMNHNWGDWYEVIAATEESEGLERHDCKNNPEHYEERPIPVLAHTHELTKTEAKNATCTEDGNTAYWTCSKCHKLFSDKDGKNETTAEAVKIPAAHTITKVAAKAATCTEDGNQEHWECTVCHKLFSDKDGKNETTAEAVKIPAAHTLDKHVAEKPATCTAKGNVEYWQCKVCHKTFSDAAMTNEITTIETDMLPHSLTKTEAKAATCTEDGNKDYWTCSVCKKLFADAEGKNETTEKDVTISKLGHDLEKTAAKAATCLEDGNIEYYTCKNDGCGKLFADKDGKKEIKIEDTVVKGAHKFEEGECTVCGYYEKAFVARIIKTDANSVTPVVHYGRDFTFTANTRFEHFVTVYIDGKELPASAYSVKKGSTEVKIKSSYIGTLAAGNHSISIESVYPYKELPAGTTLDDSVTNERRAYSAYTTFTINTSPATADYTDVARVTLIVVLAIFGTAATVYVLRRRKNVG